MTGVDIAIVAVLAVAVILGFRRGFIQQIVSLLGTLLAFVCAYLFHDKIAPYITSWLPHFEKAPALAPYAQLYQGLQLERFIGNAVSFMLLFAGVKLGLTVIGGFLNLLAKVPGLGAANRLGGAALALLEAAVALWLVINVASLLPGEGVQKALQSSRMAAYFLNDAPDAVKQLHKAWNKSVEV